MKNKLKFHQ